MRLINVKTSRLEEFLGPNVPPYAILSHTWGPDSEELNFRDIENGKIDKPGIGCLKFRGCSQLAAMDGLGYAWIDTCCIDKANLVELSEAINSMFRWYQSAAICYAFLSDVPGDENAHAEGSKFRESRWFRRGWTLQEILAPKKLRFYGINALPDTNNAQDTINGNVIQEWRLLGTKGNTSTTISSITGIPREYLLGVAQIHEASIAQRMSWAARRETKREEDLAYCLLGIFNITMPMIYGEGCDQAFFRLQEQIMKATRDDSILAWGLTNEPSANETCTVTSGRVLAKSPLDFANCGHIIRRDQLSQHTRPVDISGGSIRVYLPLITTSKNQTFGLLGCGPENNAQQVVAIPLVELPAGSPDEYIRPQGYNSSLYSIASPEVMPKQIQIKHDSRDSESVDSSELYFHYEEEDFSKIGLKIFEVIPQKCWDEERALIISTTANDPGSTQILLRLRNNTPGSKDFVILLRYKEQRLDNLAECLIFISNRNISLEELSSNLPSMMEKLNGKVRAKNECISLHITLERFKRQPIFVIRPEKVLDDTFATVDATACLVVTSKAPAVEKMLRDTATQKIEFQPLNDPISTLGDQTTTLRRAATKGLVKEVKELLEKGTDVNAADKNGWTPLLAASEYEHVEVAEMLVKKGADLEAKAEGGMTPLLVASASGCFKLVQMLLNQGADIETKDTEGITPLIAASYVGSVDIVSLLLRSGARKETKTKGDLTALKVALMEDHKNVVEILLDQEPADIEDINGNDLESAAFDDQIPASEFALLKAFDPLWREHFGQFIKEEKLQDDFIKENEQFVLEIFKEKQLMPNHCTTPYSPTHSLATPSGCSCYHNVGGNDRYDWRPTRMNTE